MQVLLVLPCCVCAIMLLQLGFLCLLAGTSHPQLLIA
jgi:hypothetical protein